MQKRCAKIRYYEHDINSTDRSKELAIVTVVVLLMFLRVDGHAHPGMDTALKFGGLSLGTKGASCACVSISKDIVWARRPWHELSIYHLRALGSPSSRPLPSSFAASAAPLFLESGHQLQCILVINFPQHLIRQLKSIDPPERVPLPVVLEILVARLERPKIPLVFI